MVKRSGKLFEAITDIDNIYLAYRHARKGKTWQDTIKRFEANLAENLKCIQSSLADKGFTTSPYQTFVIYEPKQRIIYKLPFDPDRIVQHALMNVIEPIWDRMFIHDSYSCRKGKGIHAGSRRTMEFIRQVGVDAYCLKMDVSKFYPSIDHDILYETAQRKIKCKDTLWLLRDIIYSMPGETNVPIGNYTSQWLGNLYLNELDQMLKHRYRIRHYIRYCDDLAILHRDKGFLREIMGTITDFLKSNLKLSISRQAIFPIKQGIDFLGYRHFPTYILLRKSTAKRIKRRLFLLPELLKKGRITTSQLQSSIASTEGWLRWCNAYNFERRLNLERLKGLCTSG